MLDERDLQAIAQLMNQVMDEKLAQQKEEILRETAHQMKVLLDAEVTPKFNLLAEAIQNLQEQMVPSERVEAVENDVAVLKVAVRHHSQELQELKKAN